ncbi:sugar-binding domain-containing protein [Vallitalea guaymasensis]|uniref:sugar-binding domain-containing protein n=1 Tax=Vallitalea guaymasensis TaxID=1185412 RepID=UPI0023556248|nr:sugar-binding domain-containing protein [Vallitalea guaymasensis]
MREIISLNSKWRFIKGDDSSSHLNDYDDSSWDKVNLPHRIDITPINSSGGRNYQGICRYRKHFNLEKKMKGEKVFLEFEGAMQVLEVWMNNEKLATHYCGYTPAVYDISSLVNYNAENIISVRLDNSDRSDVPPGKKQQDLDFSYDGGIYRQVRLHRVNPLYITNAVLENKVAGGGLFVSFDSVSKDKAQLRIQTHIRNEYNESKTFTLSQKLLDKEDRCVSETYNAYELNSSEDAHYVQSQVVIKPNLWHPHSPYMYKLRTEIMIDGELSDLIETPLGIRDFEFTKDRGFLINNEYLKISGANYHQTFIHVGNAMSSNLLKRDARKLREAGMIHIRSHYPFSEDFIDECDRLGITLTISNPGWQFYEEGIFKERSYQNLKDIVRWLRNHPSIIIWEPILNESVMPEDYQLRVNEIVHEELPYGPCYTGSDQGLGDISYRKFDPYMLGPKSENFDPEAYKIIEKQVDKPRWIREYGDYPDNFVDQSCAWRVPRGWGEDIMLKQVRRMIWNKNPWMTNYTYLYNDAKLCGFAMWPGIEHNRGYHINPCWGGFLDLQRIPKYSFYFFKSQREPDDYLDLVDSGPMVYIANSWSEVSPDDITIFSNCDKIRLYHNDRFIEEREPDKIKIKHPPFTFKNNFYFGRERSEIRTEGIIDGKVVASDKRYSPGVPVKLHLEGDYMGLNLQADGSDLLFVRCIVHDDKNSITPLTLDNHDILFSIEGPGKIIGDNIKRPELGQTGILIQSTTQPGNIHVKAELLHPQKYEKIAVKSGSLEITTY